jgi:hypothetical protein
MSPGTSDNEMLNAACAQESLKSSSLRRCRGGGRHRLAAARGSVVEQLAGLPVEIVARIAARPLISTPLHPAALRPSQASAPRFL